MTSEEAVRCARAWTRRSPVWLRVYTLDSREPLKDLTRDFAHVLMEFLHPSRSKVPFSVQQQVNDFIAPVLLSKCSSAALSLQCNTFLRSARSPHTPLPAPDLFSSSRSLVYLFNNERRAARSLCRLRCSDVNMRRYLLYKILCCYF